MSKSYIKIFGYIFAFLFSYIALILISSYLPTSLGIILLCANLVFFSYVAIFFLDMTVPFFNLINRVPVRLPLDCEKSVMLTFDDGPANPYTLEILDILDRFSTKATFFCIGENIAQHPDIVSEISRRGHSIGNHSYHHHILPFLPPEKILEEIKKTSQIIQEITGKNEKWFRFPKGFQSRKGFMIAKSLGLVPLGFSYPIYDVQNPPAQELVDRTLNKVKSGDILLMHDGFLARKPGSRSSLVEALPKILEGIQKKNLRFVLPEEVFN